MNALFMMMLMPVRQIKSLKSYGVKEISAIIPLKERHHDLKGISQENSIRSRIIQQESSGSCLYLLLMSYIHGYIISSMECVMCFIRSDENKRMHKVVMAGI